MEEETGWIDPRFAPKPVSQRSSKNLLATGQRSFKFKMAVLAETSVRADKCGLMEIPEEIYSKRKLRELNLCKNKILVLAPELYNLKHLRVLRIDFNYITFIPPGISQLKHLQVFSLESNHVSTVPLELGALEELEVLNLVGNPLNEPVVESGPSLKSIYYECPDENVEENIDLTQHDAVVKRGTHAVLSYLRGILPANGLEDRQYETDEEYSSDYDDAGELSRAMRSADAVGLISAIDAAQTAGVSDEQIQQANMLLTLLIEMRAAVSSDERDENRIAAAAGAWEEYIGSGTKPTGPDYEACAKVLADFRSKRRPQPPVGKPRRPTSERARRDAPLWRRPRGGPLSAIHAANTLLYMPKKPGFEEWLAAKKEEEAKDRKSFKAFKAKDYHEQEQRKTQREQDRERLARLEAGWPTLTPTNFLNYVSQTPIQSRTTAAKERKPPPRYVWGKEVPRAVVRPLTSAERLRASVRPASAEPSYAGVPGTTAGTQVVINAVYSGTPLVSRDNARRSGTNAPHSHSQLPKRLTSSSISSQYNIFGGGPASSTTTPPGVTLGGWLANSPSGTAGTNTSSLPSIGGARPVTSYSRDRRSTLDDMNLGHLELEVEPIKEEEEETYPKIRGSSAASTQSKASSIQVGAESMTTLTYHSARYGSEDGQRARSARPTSAVPRSVRQSLSNKSLAALPSPPAVQPESVVEAEALEKSEESSGTATLSDNAMEEVFQEGDQEAAEEEEQGVGGNGEERTDELREEKGEEARAGEDEEPLPEVDNNNAAAAEEAEGDDGHKAETEEVVGAADEEAQPDFLNTFGAEDEEASAEPESLQASGFFSMGGAQQGTKAGWSWNDHVFDNPGQAAHEETIAEGGEEVAAGDDEGVSAAAGGEEAGEEQQEAEGTEYQADEAPEPETSGRKEEETGGDKGTAVENEGESVQTPEAFEHEDKEAEAAASPEAEAEGFDGMGTMGESGMFNSGFLPLQEGSNEEEEEHQTGEDEQAGGEEDEELEDPELLEQAAQFMALEEEGTVEEAKDENQGQEGGEEEGSGEGEEAEASDEDELPQGLNEEPPEEEAEADEQAEPEAEEAQEDEAEGGTEPPEQNESEAGQSVEQIDEEQDGPAAESQSPLAPHPPPARTWQNNANGKTSSNGKTSRLARTSYADNMPAPQDDEPPPSVVEEE